ncbi:hypothetical protein [Zobellia roscoffensis]|uniref:hypothetical protein n=1 Tax=Zobellia roscoffensis TaxID=2779508 RepID=UPI001D036849|nr:hypothetical protein [Zobellia roscoffensis]
MNKAKGVYDLVSNVVKGGVSTNTILLGDSVCKQFYEKVKNEEYYCFCENQSYELPGNFLLLKSLVENDSHFNKMVLVMNPLTLISSLNQDYTYNYFVKPFRGQLKNLESKEVNYIKNTFPSEELLKFKFSNFKMPNPSNSSDISKLDAVYISEVNMRYLKKIDSICNARGIDFKMVSPPLPLNNKQVIESFFLGSEPYLKEYFKSVTYYDSIDSKDGIHHQNAEKFILKNSEQLDALLQFRE